MKIGKRIQIFRKLINLSQAALAKRSGIKREYLSKLETGKHKNPTIGTLETIAGALEIDTVELLGGRKTNATDQELMRERIKRQRIQEELDRVYLIVASWQSQAAIFLSATKKITGLRQELELLSPREE